MLMYDECARTTPLGPDEYVLVMFKTVEVEDGEEKLEHYVLHLFTDGTIIYIEDGVPDPGGRARVIEGQRGAVGFGRSPHCNFDHVIAEFQIELAEASNQAIRRTRFSGGRACHRRPRPRHRQHQAPRSFRPSSFRPSPTLGERYQLDVTVREESTSPQNVQVTVRELTDPPNDRARGFGDTFFIDVSTANSNFSPGSTQAFIFPQFAESRLPIDTTGIG